MCGVILGPLCDSTSILGTHTGDMAQGVMLGLSVGLIGTDRMSMSIF